MLSIRDYIRPKTLEEALESLQQYPGEACILAGGTDLLLRRGAENDQPFRLIDISAVESMIGISEINGYFRIGACTLLKEIERSDQLIGGAKALVQGARVIGSVQIRNLATLGGNLCNASPSADTAAALLVLEAEAEIASLEGLRTIPLRDFFVGPGETDLSANEILTAVRFPIPPDGYASLYIKHSVRAAMDLAIVGVSGYLARENGRLDARLALAAVAPVPMRVPEAEQLLSSSPSLDEETIRAAATLAMDACSPISDLRASSAYRREMVRNLTARALRTLGAELERGNG